MSAVEGATSRHEHTVVIVPCRTGKGFFLYTEGADPEFLIEDVPAEYVRVCGDALNYMVERTRSGLAADTGHNVTFGPCQFVQETLHGGALCYARVCRVGALCPRSVVRLRLDTERRQPETPGDGRPLTTGVLPASTPEECPVCHASVDGETVWRNPQQSDIPTRCNHYCCVNCWEGVARHDQRCPLCRTDVSEWIRRHLFETREPTQLFLCALSCLAPDRLHSLRETLASAETLEAREAAVRQMLQEVEPAAVPRDA